MTALVEFDKLDDTPPKIITINDYLFTSMMMTAADDKRRYSWYQDYVNPAKGMIQHKLQYIESRKIDYATSNHNTVW